MGLKKKKTVKRLRMQMGGDPNAIKAQLMALYGPDWEQRAGPQALEAYRAAQTQARDVFIRKIQKEDEAQRAALLAEEKRRKAEGMQQKTGRQLKIDEENRQHREALERAEKMPTYAPVSEQMKAGLAARYGAGWKQKADPRELQQYYAVSAAENQERKRQQEQLSYLSARVQLDDLQRENDSLLTDGLHPFQLMSNQQEAGQLLRYLGNQQPELVQDEFRKAKTTGKGMLLAGKYIFPQAAPVFNAINNGVDAIEFAQNPNDPMNQSQVGSDVLSQFTSRRTKIKPFGLMGDVLNGVEVFQEASQYRGGGSAGGGLPFYQGGGIHIDPEHAGDFTAFAQSMGMGVQEAAAHVLANKEQYSPQRVKQANFARNAAGWRKQDGGLAGGPNLNPAPAPLPAPLDYTPFFRTEEERSNYLARLKQEAVKALRQDNDKNYLVYNSYHPEPDGHDCINGICGLDLKAGLRFSNPADGDRYLSNTRFVENIQKGKEDYYQVNAPREGDHLQLVTGDGKPYHSLQVYDVERDKDGKPVNYHAIHNFGGTEFTDRVYSAQEMKDKINPAKGVSPSMIAWRPGKFLDAEKIARGRMSKVPFPYNQTEGAIERYFGDTELPTRFSLKEEGLSPNSPLYYLSGKDVQDQTKNQLLELMNDKEMDRQLREKLRINDATLQNLKPVLFGIAGVEGSYGNISAGRDLKERVAEAVTSNPSVGLFQIRMGSVSDRAKNAFGINNEEDLKDIRKAYAANIDRLLEGKRVTDAMVDQGKLPELADLDPYFRSAYYYNQPGKVLAGDEGWAKKNFVYAPFTIPNPLGRDVRISTGLNASQADVAAAYDAFLNQNRLRGDKGSYMHKVQQAAYPLNMEVLDDETPATLPAVEVVGRRNPRVAVKAKGGAVSTQGYKADSPDRFNAFNVIPSNQITMQGVPHPVLGVDNQGNHQLMLPGYQYQFPGQAVLEVPVGSGKSYESPSGDSSGKYSRQGLRAAQRGGVIPPFEMEMRLHEPKTKDSMLAADSPVFYQKQAVDTAMKNREVLSRTPAQQAAYAQNYFTRQLQEEDRKEAQRQRELDRRAKAIAQSDAIQANTSFFSPERWSRQNLAVISQATPERFRLFPESVGGPGEFVDNYLNPLTWVGNIAKGLGEAPLQAQQTNSITPYFRAVGTPLVAGALGANPLSTITDPIRGAFTSKGLSGQAQNLWKNVVESNAVDNLKDKTIEGVRDELLPLGPPALGAGFRYGGGYPHYGYRQEGGPVNETQVQKDWLESYVKSKKYWERLNQEGFADPEAERQARLQNLQQVPLRYSRDLGWNQGAYMPREYKGMMYKQGWEPAAPEPDPIFGIEKPGMLYLNPRFRPGQTPEAKFATTPAHEYSHVLDDGDFRIPNQTIDKIYNYTDKQDQDKAQLNGRTFGYKNDPSEVIARMQSVRYLLNKANIHDARTQNFDEATYEKMLSNPEIQGNSDFQELFGMLKGNDAEKKQRFMDLMNTVASRGETYGSPLRAGDPSGKGSTMARYGGGVSRESIVGSRESALRQYLAPPPMQSGGSADNTGLYPFEMFNPFDVNPYRRYMNSIGVPGPPPPPLPPVSTSVPSPFPAFQDFMRNRNVLSKDNPVSTDPDAFSLDPDIAAVGQMKGFRDFMKKKTILSKDNQNPIGVNPFTTPQGTKTYWGPNVGAAAAAVRTMGLFNNIAESGARNRYKQQELFHNLGDSKGALLPADWEERRGDYDVNSGGFRMDRMYPTQFGVAQMGGMAFSEPKLNVAVMADPELPVLPVPPARQEPRGNSQGMALPDIKVNEGVKPNKAAWDAFHYYVNERGLEPMDALAIVGNLYRESGMETDVKEKGHTGNGRGIAQWDVRDRWKGLHKWAEQQERDPYDLYTQLDYVLAEPGEGEKALKAMAQASTLEDKVYTFGKVYERPLDKKHLPPTKNPARWDIRAGIAQKMLDSYMEQNGSADNTDVAQMSQMGQYQMGGEYVVTPEQLQRILAAGGEVEYV